MSDQHAAVAESNRVLNVFAVELTAAASLFGMAQEANGSTWH